MPPSPGPVPESPDQGSAELGDDLGPRPLAGFRIAVTADRRGEELVAALSRRGAQVLHAPALRTAPVGQDEALVADTATLIGARPEFTVVTTAYGLRRWTEAADRAGIGEPLRQALAASRILVRGPKARGAVRAEGLDDDGIAADERTSTVVDLLLARGVGGKTVAVQLHGYADVEQLDRLRAAGAQVLTVTPYRWVAPHDGDRLARLIEAVCAHSVDLVTFTSAPAVDALISTAGMLGCAEPLVAALRDGVVAAAVGPVTAQPLVEAGIHPIVPERFRLGALVRLVAEHLAMHHVTRVESALGVVELRGSSVLLGPTRVSLAPGPLAIFRALAAAGGGVLTREELMKVMPDRVDRGDGGSEHALDMAMSRLRSSLPDAGLVTTVVKRGYRLNA